ncbi:hypothetical protein ACIBJI_30490 [Nocardia sp. NPDC050408]|uniref:hypothetical protein n=1 Tax=unclassified Nocardia TaxID=2637762 RepID=UPI00341E3206
MRGDTLIGALIYRLADEYPWLCACGTPLAVLPADTGDSTKDRYVGNKAFRP